MATDINAESIDLASKLSDMRLNGGSLGRILMDSCHLTPVEPAGAVFTETLKELNEAWSEKRWERRAVWKSHIFCFVKLWIRRQEKAI